MGFIHFFSERFRCFSLFFFFKIYSLFILFYFWLRWVLVSAHRIFVEARRTFRCSTRASLQLWRVGFLFSSCGTQAPGCTGSVVVARGLQLRSVSSVVWHVGLAAPWHVGSYFPDQGLNPRPLHCKVYSLPLDRQGSPSLFLM